MPSVPVRRCVTPFACLWLVVTAMAGTVSAQSRLNCQAPQRPSIGGVFGRSSPSAELSRGVIDLHQWESATLEGGPLLGARADASLAGPLRVRLEGSTTWWHIVRRTYSPEPNYGVVATTSAGRMSMRQLVASVGLAGGRPPLCAHVMVGGGLYSLSYRDVAHRHGGFSISAGVEVPVGRRTVLQTDVYLHVIDFPDGYPTGSTAILAAALTAGWAFRF